MALLRGRPACSSPIGARTRARLWLVPIIVAGLGEHPRQLLPRPGGRSGWPGSRTSTTASRGRTGRSLVAVVSARRRLRHAVRAGGLGLRRRAVDEPARSPRGSPSGSRRRSATCPGILFFASALAVVAAHRPARPRSSRGRRSPGSASSSLIGAVRDPRRRLVAARRGRRRSPGSLVDRPVAGPGAPRVEHAADAPAQRVVVGGCSSSPASRCCRSGDRSTPDLGAPGRRRRPTRRPGITAALRDAARGRATACSTRSRGARGSSSRCPTCRSPSTRGSSSSRPTVWDAYEGVVAGGEGWQAQLDGWGVTIVVVAAGRAATGGPARGRRLAGRLQRRRRIGPGRAGPIGPAIGRESRLDHDPGRVARSSRAAPARRAAKHQQATPRGASRGDRQRQRRVVELGIRPDGRDGEPLRAASPQAQRARRTVGTISHVPHALAPPKRYCDR